MLTNGWQDYVIIGFAGSMAGTLGPTLAAWIGKLKFRRKKLGH